MDDDKDFSSIEQYSERETCGKDVPVSISDNRYRIVLRDSHSRFQIAKPRFSIIKSPAKPNVQPKFHGRKQLKVGTIHTKQARYAYEKRGGLQTTSKWSIDSSRISHFEDHLHEITKKVNDNFLRSITPIALYNFIVPNTLIRTYEIDKKINQGIVRAKDIRNQNLRLRNINTANSFNYNSFYNTSASERRGNRLIGNPGDTVPRGEDIIPDKFNYKSSSEESMASSAFTGDNNKSYRMENTLNRKFGASLQTQRRSYNDLSTYSYETSNISNFRESLSRDTNFSSLHRSSKSSSHFPLSSYEHAKQKEVNFCQEMPTKVLKQKNNVRKLHAINKTENEFKNIRSSKNKYHDSTYLTYQSERYKNKQEAGKEQAEEEEWDETEKGNEVVQKKGDKVDEKEKEGQVPEKVETFYQSRLSNNNWVLQFICEFLGSFLYTFYCILCSMNNPIYRTVLCNSIHGNGFTYAGLIVIFGHLSGGHMNPAITLGVLIAGYINLIKAAVYIILQYVGAYYAGYFVKYWFPDEIHYGETAPGNRTEEMAYFHRIHYVNNIIDVRTAVTLEAFMTTVLVLIYLGVGISRSLNCPGTASVTVAFLYVAFGHLTVSITGTSLNPARSFASSMLGTYKDQWVYFIGPIVGSVIGGVLFRVLAAYLLKR